MANSWGTNPIILDTAADDTTYAVGNDVIKTAGATEYSSGQYDIESISIQGADTQQVTLQHCTPDASVDNGAIFFDEVLATATGLYRPRYLGNFTAKGIYPKTITSGAKVYIYLKQK